MADVIDLQARRTARQSGAAVSAVEPNASTVPSDWICRLDVFAPRAAGGDHRAAFLDFNLADGLDTSARLNLIATALEQIATSLRQVAQADAS